MPLDGPPAHAWDWVARQRFVWSETRRRLIAQGYASASPGRSGAGPTDDASTVRTPPAGDVPDWSLDHPDLLVGGRTVATQDVGPEGATPTRRDYAELDTRAGCIAALRADYPNDALVRATVDAVVGELAFLGRLDVPLHTLGVRSAPRGMRWWWTRLTGRDADEGRSDRDGSDERGAPVPLQLRLVDVLAGYGDVTDA